MRLTDTVPYEIKLQAEVGKEMRRIFAKYTFPQIKSHLYSFLLNNRDTVIKLNVCNRASTYTTELFDHLINLFDRNICDVNTYVGIINSVKTHIVIVTDLYEFINKNDFSGAIQFSVKTSVEHEYNSGNVQLPNNVFYEMFQIAVASTEIIETQSELFRAIYDELIKNNTEQSIQICDLILKHATFMHEKVDAFKDVTFT